MRYLAGLLLAGTCSCILAAPASVQERQRGAEPAGKSGVVFVVDGIGGTDVFPTAARYAFQRAGVTHEIRDYVWTHGFGLLLRDLQDIRHLLRKADELAAEVARIKAEDPDRPIYFVAKSGGTGLVLAAAERLPPQTLERIILLSSAVTPTYDLRPALRATKGEIVSFNSANDLLVLGLGTSQFGSIDRIYGPSAGYRGFKIPEDCSEQERVQYKRLVQINWRYGMLLEGNPGTHFGTSLPAFLRNEVAPWLKK